MLLVSRYKPDGLFGGTTEGFDLRFQINAAGTPVTSGQAVVIGFTLPNSSAPIVGVEADVDGADPVPLAEDMNTAGAPSGASTLRLWSVRNLTNGATHVNVRLTADTFLEPVIYVISGMAATSHLGTPATDEGSTFVEGQPTVDVTTDAANEAIIALIELSVGDALTPGAGFTLLPGGATESSFHAMDDDDVGAAGSRAVGATGYVGSWRISAQPYKNAAVGSAPTLSSPTPSGTIGTQTTASVGATTTDSTGGTFYAVVDTASLSGITASQIKAGQNAGGGAALQSGSVTVSSTSPAVGITGLSAGTTYNYACIHNNSTGDSNIVTGSFTTASPTPASSPPVGRGRRLATLMLT